MDPSDKDERDTRARNFAAIANACPYSAVHVNGVPFPGITRIKLTKEQLEEVRGSENKATG